MSNLNSLLAKVMNAPEKEPEGEPNRGFLFSQVNLT